MKCMMTFAAALLLAGNAQANPEPNQAATATELGAVAQSAQPAAAVVDAFHAALRREGQIARSQRRDSRTLLLFVPAGVVTVTVSR